MICNYCDTKNCGTVLHGDGSPPTRTVLCRHNEYVNHCFFIGDKVKLKGFSDGFLDDYEKTEQGAPQCLVLMEREKRAATVVSKEQMYKGSDQVTVEVDGHQTVLWNKFLVKA